MNWFGFGKKKEPLRVPHPAIAAAVMPPIQDRKTEYVVGLSDGIGMAYDILKDQIQKIVDAKVKMALAEAQVRWDKEFSDYKSREGRTPSQKVFETYERILEKYHEAERRGLKTVPDLKAQLCILAEVVK